MEKLKLRRIGKNFWGMETYQDENGRYYQGNEHGIYYNSPADDLDGEPERLLNREYEIINPKSDREKREEQHEFDYIMCSRISQDIRAFLHGGPGDCRYKNERMLGQSIRSLMEELKKYWAKIPADLKPDWLTQEQIDSWEKEIG